MVDTGDKETDDLIHEIWRDAGVYNEDCYDGKSDVNLKNCSYGCYKAHVTGSVNMGGKCDNTQPNVGLMLAQRRRRWANIDPTLVQLISCADVEPLLKYL